MTTNPQDKGSVFNVWFPEESGGEPTLFERRDDAAYYADLTAAKVEEVAVMDEATAANFISEAEAEIEADDA
jgi:hypothetical protein